MDELEEINKLLRKKNQSIHLLDIETESVINETDYYLDQQLYTNNNILIHINKNEDLPDNFAKTSYGMNIDSYDDDSLTGHKVLYHKDHNVYYRSASSDSYSLSLTHKKVGNKTFYDPLDINENDFILDLGGYIGIFANYAQLKGARVISYEPNIESCNIFKMNSNVILNNKAISKVNSVLPFYVLSHYMFSSLYNITYNDDYFKLIKEYNVNTVTLEEALMEYDFNCIKCDIMGEELNLNWIMPSGIKKILICFYPYKVDLGYCKMYNIIAHLTKQGFKSKNIAHTLNPKKTNTTAFNLFFHRL
jgi:FkbM family methyltransferase